MPFFFLATGLKTTFSIANPLVWTIFVAGLGVCVVGKIASTMVAARCSGENWAFGLTVGVLLQSKGLMELVVARIFYDKQVIGQTTFSAMVMVALVSTALTIPATSLVLVIFGEKVMPKQPAPVPDASPLGDADLPNIEALGAELETSPK